MVADGSEHEPDEPEEPDPEADFRDPESDSLTIPRVDTEDAGSGLTSDLRSDFVDEDVKVPEVDAPTGTEADVPPDLQKTFWALVIVVNGAVLGIALGAMLLVFEGDTDRGVPLLAGGFLLFGFAYRRYRQFRISEDEDRNGDDSGSGTDDDLRDDESDVDAATDPGESG